MKEKQKNLSAEQQQSVGLELNVQFGWHHKATNHQHLCCGWLIVQQRFFI